MRARNCVADVVGAILLIPALPAAITAHADTLTATYVSTLGGPGHAAMYPSGMEIAPRVLISKGCSSAARRTE